MILQPARITCKLALGLICIGIMWLLMVSVNYSPLEQGAFWARMGYCGIARPIPRKDNSIHILLTNRAVKVDILVTGVGWWLVGGWFGYPSEHVRFLCVVMGEVYGAGFSLDISVGAWYNGCIDLP